MTDARGVSVSHPDAACTCISALAANPACPQHGDEPPAAAIRRSELADIVRRCGVCPEADACTPPNPESDDCAGCLMAWAALISLESRGRVG